MVASDSQWRILVNVVVEARSWNVVLRPDFSHNLKTEYTTARTSPSLCAIGWVTNSIRMSSQKTNMGFSQLRCWEERNTVVKRRFGRRTAHGAQPSKNYSSILFLFIYLLNIDVVRSSAQNFPQTLCISYIDTPFLRQSSTLPSQHCTHSILLLFSMSYSGWSKKIISNWLSGVVFQILSSTSDISCLSRFPFL